MLEPLGQTKADSESGEEIPVADYANVAPEKFTPDDASPFQAPMAYELAPRQNQSDKPVPVPTFMKAWGIGAVCVLLMFASGVMIEVFMLSAFEELGSVSLMLISCLLQSLVLWKMLPTSYGRGVSVSVISYLILAAVGLGIFAMAVGTAG